jgi:CDP-6-deoxy-D-xylo-4-hexulose-3-dehydrase
MKYSLVSDTIRDADIDALSDWLKTYPRLSKGELTPQFEELWANWLGTKHAVYVNSGSSANLIILIRYPARFKASIVRLQFE